MNTLYMTLMRINALQNTASDRLALVEAVDSAYKSVTTASDAELDPQRLLNTISAHLQSPRFQSVRQLDPAAMPVLVHDAEKGFALVRGLNARQQWVIERFDDEQKKWVEEVLEGKPQGAFSGGWPPNRLKPTAARCFASSPMSCGDLNRSLLRFSLAASSSI